MTNPTPQGSTVEVASPLDAFIEEVGGRSIHGSGVSPEMSTMLGVLHVLRVQYLQMVAASARPMLDSRGLTARDQGIKHSLAYSGFISTLNQYGRILEKQGLAGSPGKPELPLYRRLYFFRNNMIEHIDEHMRYLAGGWGGWLKTAGIVAVQVHAGANARPADASAAFARLVDAFAAENVTPSVTAADWHEAYADKVYTDLSAIDSKLRLRRRPGEPGIPVSLTNELFAYSFPTPIWDVEEYCADLVSYLRAVVA